MTATAVPLWNVAAFGWVCIGRHQHADTTVDTWTGGHEVLVLVWSGEANVVAAVLNGEPLDLDDLETEITGGKADDLEDLLDRAAVHAARAYPNRVGTELEQLFDATRRTTNASRRTRPDAPVFVRPLRERAALHNLALAVLSTPGT